MKNIRKYLIIFVIIQVIALLFINGLTYARYVSNSVFNYYLKSKSFYFTSDYLSLNGTKNVNNFWDGERTYFNIKNSINQSAVSESDIGYTVTCDVGDLSSNVDCFINGFNSNIYNGTLSVFKSCVNDSNDGVDVSEFTETECEVAGYVYKNHAMDENIYFDLIAKNGYEINDVNVNITVSSTPYNKILKGNFLLHKALITDGSIESSYTNYDSYDRLTITNTYLQNKCVNVKFNSDNLRVENDNLSIITTDNNGYINSFKFNLEAQSNKSYIFYRTTENTYTLNDFIIEESNGC